MILITIGEGMTTLPDIVYSMSADLLHYMGEILKRKILYKEIMFSVIYFTTPLF